MDLPEGLYLLFCAAVVLGVPIGIWVYINFLKRKRGKDE